MKVFLPCTPRKNLMIMTFMVRTSGMINRYFSLFLLFNSTFFVIFFCSDSKKRWLRSHRLHSDKNNSRSENCPDQATAIKSYSGSHPKCSRYNDVLENIKTIRCRHVRFVYWPRVRHHQRNGTSLPHDDTF